LHCAPVSSVVPAPMSKKSFFFCSAWVATASAADDVGTSKIASTPLRSYISWALVLAISGWFWWSAEITSMLSVTASLPYFSLKSATAISTAFTAFGPASSE
jgi:hypothetical protein